MGPDEIPSTPRPEVRLFIAHVGDSRAVLSESGVGYNSIVIMLIVYRIYLQSFGSLVILLYKIVSLDCCTIDNGSLSQKQCGERANRSCRWLGAERPVCVLID